MTGLNLAVDPYFVIDTLYDAEHDSFDDDIDLYLSLTEQMDGPLLELGCGSGRVLAPLAEAGLEVVGIDVSEAMLRRAGLRLDSLEQPASATVGKVDMRAADQAPGGPFTLAIYSLNALMHLETQDDQIRSLEAVAGALTDDGSVLIDVINPTPDYLEQIAGLTLLEWTGKMGDGTMAQKWAHREIDVHAQTIETRLWYDLTSPDGGLRRLHTGFTLRYVYLAELALMLKEAGFGEPTTYGSYQLDPLDGMSERLIVTAEKRT